MAYASWPLLIYLVLARFPNTNQTRHWCVGNFESRVNYDEGVLCSFQNYTDYFKCIAAKGDDYAPCKQFKRAYHSLCPSA
jgi:cytochrome c oxidase subunit 6b